jgi:hypothetical protein
VKEGDICFDDVGRLFLSNYFNILMVGKD